MPSLLSAPGMLVRTRDWVPEIGELRERCGSPRFEEECYSKPPRGLGSGAWGSCSSDPSCLTFRFRPNQYSRISRQSPRKSVAGILLTDRWHAIIYPRYPLTISSAPFVMLRACRGLPLRFPGGGKAIPEGNDDGKKLFGAIQAAIESLDGPSGCVALR